MIDDVEPELELRWSGGSLDLFGWNESPYGEFEVEALADGTNWGNKESVRRALRSAMRDGSRSVKDRDNNRTVALSLRVAAPDGSALAGGEAALAMIDGRACELVWTPPDDVAAPAVFVVDFADLKHEMDDFAENAKERFYTLSLSCLPHVFSDEWLDIPALAQSVSTRTVFDTCDTTTGWTSFQVTVADGGDYVRIDYPAGNDSGIAARNGAVDFTTDRYLSVQYAGGGIGRVVKAEVLVSGAWREVYRVGTDGGADLYDVGLSVQSIAFSFERPAIFKGTGAKTAIGITALGKQSTMRTAASKGHVRTITSPGVYRTPVHISAVSAAGDLGDLVLYSGPDYDPSLNTRLAPGAQGHYVALPPIANEPTTRYRLPVSQLPPGEYAVWANLATNFGGTSANVGTLRFTAELYNSGGSLVRSTVLQEILVGGNTTVVRPLFAATLPPWNLSDGATHDFGLRVDLLSGEGQVWFDYMWLFNITTGSLVVVKAGTDSKAWIEPPSMDRDHVQILTGETTLEEALPRSLRTEVLSWGNPELAPPVATIYGWSSSATDMQISGRLRPAWDTHPPALS